MHVPCRTFSGTVGVVVSIRVVLVVVAFPFLFQRTLLPVRRVVVHAGWLHVLV